ncbi:MAG: hypothetical protein ACLUE8_16680 [Lachnospiraceae bacterium]
MGIFQKVSSWLSEKSDRLIRGSADHESGYYASRDAQDAYGGATIEDEMSQAAGETSERREPLDPLWTRRGRIWRGRIPYRSGKRMIWKSGFYQLAAGRFYESRSRRRRRPQAQQRGFRRRSSALRGRRLRSLNR